MADNAKAIKNLTAKKLNTSILDIVFLVKINEIPHVNVTNKSAKSALIFVFIILPPSSSININYFLKYCTYTITL